MLPAVVSADGRLATTMWTDERMEKAEIRLIDTNTGKRIRTWDNCDQLEGAPVRLDGKGKLLVAQGDKVTLRELPSGRFLSTLAAPAPGNRLIFGVGWSFSLDGSYLAACIPEGAGSKLQVWDVRDPRQPKKIPNPPALEATRFAFNSQGNAIAFVSDKKALSLWEFQTAKTPSVIELPVPVTDVMEFGKKDRLLALVSDRDDGLVFLWDFSEKKEYGRLDLGRGDVATALAFSPDGNRLAVGTFHGALLIFDVQSGKELTRVELAHNGEIVVLLRWQTDGNHLVSCGDAAFKAWELTEQTLRTPSSAGTAGVTAIAYSPDGQWLAVGAEKRPIRLIKRTSGQVVHDWDIDPSGLAELVFSPDSARLALVRTDLASTWDVMSGKETMRLPVTGSGQYNSWISGTFARNSDLHVLKNEDGRLSVWDAAGKLVWQGSGKGGVGCLSHDGHRLAEFGNSLSQPVTIRELPQGQQALQLPAASSAEAMFGQAQFSPDGRWLVANFVWAAPRSAATGLAIWNLETKDYRLLAVGMGASGELLIPYRISPDSRLLAVGNKDGSIQIFDLEKGEQLFKCSMQKHPIFALAFSPEGETLTVSDEHSGTLQHLNLSRLRTELAKIGLDW
jgi:WD40 repeat protein